MPGMMPAEGEESNNSSSGGASPARSSASEESWDNSAGGPLDGAALRRLAAERANLLTEQHAPLARQPLTPKARPSALHDDIDGIPGK